MNYLKLFEAYFDDKEDTTWEEISSGQFMEFQMTHPRIMNHDYNDAFDIFDESYNLYQKDSNDFNNNQYRITPTALEIYLVSKKTDIYVSALEDDYYFIKVLKYRDYSDEDYYDVDYFLADGIEGVNDWLAQF